MTHSIIIVVIIIIIIIIITIIIIIIILKSWQDLVCPIPFNKQWTGLG